ncbi:hypothetical protein F2Q69_00055426 [Brassica cretica]|uniref:Uncharacterized protein n=1 Tax=Brassica cretica TaxID=69181 RepID=A0A8S9MT52_BRACR|nr:hypothetical protein F2Q69_00055426 [Brassica cretica]
MGVSAGDSTLGVVFAAAQRSRPVVPRRGGIISFFGHDSEIIQEWICDVSAFTLLQAIVPRVFVTGDYVFVNSWGSLLDWECGSLRCIDIGATVGVVVSFWHC